MAKARLFVYQRLRMHRRRDQAGAEAPLWEGKDFLPADRGEKLTFWHLQLAGWAGLGALVFFVLSAGLVPNLLPPSAAVTFITLGFLVTSAARPVCRRVSAWRKPLPVMVFVIAALAATMLAIYESLVMLTCHVVHGDAFFYFRRLRAAGVVNHLIVLGCWLALYFLVKQKRVSRDLERENRAAALKLLRYQINPHFLFNALNSIAAHATSPEKVTLGTEALADYLRFSLAHDDLTHPLGEELAAMENYLTVEKIRFEDKLDYTIEADEATRQHPTPPAVVQPLVENAIKHGTPAPSGALQIRLCAALSSGEICIAVENSGPWISELRGNSPGTGLANLRHRLNLLYGAHAALTVEKHADRVRVAVKIPADAHR